MTFDPTWPPSHAHASSDRFREQFNGLSDKIDAVTGGTAIIHGRIISDGGDLALAAADPNGPTETALLLNNDTSTTCPIPIFGGREAGTIAYQIRIDLPGVIEGAGTPAVQDGDNIRFDAAKQAYVPRRSLAWEFSDLMALTDPISEPPTRVEVQANRDLLNEILTRLKAMI